MDRGGLHGRRRTAADAQFVSAVVDGRVDIATAVAAPRWYIQPRELLTPPIDVSFEPRHAPGVAERLRELGHQLVPTASFDSTVGHEHAIELIDGGPRSGGTLAAATDPRSDGLPAVW